eukprot:2512022-Pyramimonas_sp.AAC.1
MGPRPQMDLTASPWRSAASPRAQVGSASTGDRRREFLAVLQLIFGSRLFPVSHAHSSGRRSPRFRAPRMLSRRQ